MTNPNVYQAVLKHNEDGSFIPVLFWYDEDDPYDEGDWYIHDEGFSTENEAWNRVSELKEKQHTLLLEEEESLNNIEEEEVSPRMRILDYD